jgi:D-inositol-3-phosphate glycosyltransferase
VVATLAEKTQLRFLYHASDRKMVIIPPGVDTCHFYPIPADEAKQFIGLKPEDRMVLFVGRIEPLKGVDTLIHAVSCPDIQRLHRPVHLAIIGGEPDALPENMSEEMARLQKLCDDLCMERMVVFLGKRGQDTLPYYYSAAEVLVMPSLYESFGMVALEAMACGTPVVASEVGGLGYLVQDGQTGYTIPDSDPAALCDKLSHLLGDSHLRETMGSCAAQYALNYAWGKIAAQMVEVYQELTAKAH